MSTKVKAKIEKEKYRTVVMSDSHHFVADEPMSVGGKDLGPNPGELLTAALASCSAITIKMYAERKGWPLEEAKVEVDFENFRKEGKATFIKSVELKGNLNDEQRARLLEIGGRCPIHKILTGQIEIKETLI